MKVTNIRRKSQLLSTTELRNLAQALQIAYVRAGFLTNVEVISSSGLNISNAGTTFRVDTEHLGYNAVVGYYNGDGLVVQKASEQGYRRTSLPTWEQRVAFNRLTNKVLDSYQLACDVRASNDFVVRTKERGSIVAWRWEENKAGVLVVNEKDAAKLVETARAKKPEQMTRRPSGASEFIYHLWKPSNDSGDSGMSQ